VAYARAAKRVRWRLAARAPGALKRKLARAATGGRDVEPSQQTPGCDCLAAVHLEQMAIIVDDYDEAIRFYVEVLGFELVEDSPSLTNDGRAKRWVVVRPPGAETALLLAKADGERQQRAVGAQFAGRVGMFLRVDDFENTYEGMRAAGVEFASEPRDEPYGRVVVFVDVSGNRWDLLGPRPA
jgi:catechol 2,3-dioxygenase-like lactoylglutathione lyase family enzyme